VHKVEKMLLSFVIPCYNSALTITSVLDEVEHTVATRSRKFDYEIILVNDGSLDNTAGVIEALCTAHPHIVFVNLSRNFGQHSALMAGFAQVRGKIVICLDDDGQTPADECFKLIDKVLEGYDIVYAEYLKRRQNVLRNLGSRFNATCNHYFFNQPMGLKVNSYFACQRFVVDSALQYPNPFPYVTGLLFQSVSRYTNVTVNHRPRLAGDSGYSIKKLIALWTNGVTAFSIKPLRMANYLGWSTAIFGILFALVTIIRKLANPDIQAGWASTIAGILAIGGVIIALIGIVGEYIGRIYLSINRCPQYVVRAVIDPRQNSSHTQPEHKEEQHENHPCGMGTS